MQIEGPGRPPGAGREAGAASKREFEERLLSCRDTMYRIAFRVVGSRQDAFDALQNASLSLWKRWTELEKQDRDVFRYYAYTAAKNAALDFLRKAKRETAVREEDADPDEVPSERTDLSDEIVRRAELQTIRQAIDFLPERYRTVLTRFYASGEKIAEIAADLGVPPKTVHTRLRRGKELLAKKLKEGKWL